MLNRAIAPPFQRTTALLLPAPIEIGGSASHPIFYLEGLKQNIVKIEIIFNSGKWVESKNGLSHFTSMMLEKGTAKRSSDDIAEVLDRFGASLEISPGFDYTSIALYSLKEKLKDVFSVFLEILSASVFPEKEWVQMRNIFLQNLRVNNEKTSYQASKAIRKNIFGALHPYGSSVEEADASVIELGDLSDFFKKSFTVHSAFVLGDLSTADVDYLKAGIHTLPKGSTPVVTPFKNTALPFPEHSNKEGRSQSTIRLGKKSILKTDPAYPDLLITTHILGGFFGSRLMKNIREDKGLTYGISSSLNAFKHDSMLMIGADVNKENVSLALTEIRNEMEKMRTSLVGDTELSLARNHFIGSLQTDMANLFSVEEKLKNIHLNELENNFYHQLLNRIDQITAKEILSTAEKHFDDAAFFEVVVG